MMARTLVALIALIALIGLTAFAPAPLPKRQRAGTGVGVAVAQLQGTWVVTKLQMTRGNGRVDDQGTYLKEVRVEGERWSFFYRDANRGPVNYTLTIQHKATPAEINFYRNGSPSGQPYGTGIIRRQGDTLTMIYSWGSPRARSFENPPSGYWVITLQRAR
jgi:uncharacterized protein (TIGR03067 family)